MQQLEDLLRSLELEAFLPLFVDNQIDMKSLALLTEADLKEIGLPLGPRKLVAQAIKHRDNSEEGERRLLTVLFGDLVGSTAMSGRLDPEELETILQAYRTAANAVIADFDGHVADFAGDGFAAYFGWPNSSDEQSHQALRAALNLVDAVGKLPISGLAENVSVKVGIATGPVYAGHLRLGPTEHRLVASGEAPNRAARLQSMAKPGQIVVDESTRDLAFGAFFFDGLGLHRAKGLAQPLRCWSLRDEIEAETRFAVPTSAIAPLVGRSTELEKLEGLWLRSSEGHGGIAHVFGDAGIGKSRLIHALAESTELTQEYIIWFQCSPQHRSSDFHPIINGLRYWIGRTSRNARKYIPPSLADLLAREEIHSSGKPPNYSPQERRAELVRALSDLLRSLTKNDPYLLVIEDIQWIDPSTREALQALADEIAGLPLMIVMTERAGEPSFLLGAEILLVPLWGLSHSELVRLVRELAGSELPEDAVKNIVRRSDGIPLFAEQIARATLEAKSRAVSDSVPATLQGSLMARLDGLQNNKQVAQFAAVIGRSFDPALLSDAFGLEKPAVEAGLDALLSGDLVVQERKADGTVYSFRHALLRDVAYESLLKRKRRELHRKAADWLARPDRDCPVEWPVVGYHYEEAGQGKLASLAWERSADGARGRLAQAEAAELYGLALRHCDEAEEPERKLRLLLHLGEARFAALGGAAEATQSVFETAANLAELSGRAWERCLALYGVWIGKVISCRLAEAFEIAGKVALLANQTGNEKIRIVALRIRCAPSYLAGDIAEAQADAEEALHLSKRLGITTLVDFAHDPVATIEPTLAHILWAHGRPMTAVTMARNSVQAVLGRTVSSNTVCYAMVWKMLVLAQSRRGEELRETAEDLIVYAERTAGRFWQNLGLWGRGYSQVISGRFAEGLPLVQESAELFFSTGARQQGPLLLLAEIEARFELGDLAGAQRVLRRALGMVAETDQRYFEPELLRWRALLLAATGDPRNSERDFKQSAESASRMEMPTWELRTLESYAGFRETQSGVPETLSRRLDRIARKVEK
jgi:class 3 adenylate cyclase